MAPPFDKLTSTFHKQPQDPKPTPQDTHSSPHHSMAERADTNRPSDTHAVRPREPPLKPANHPYGIHLDPRQTRANPSPGLTADVINSTSRMLSSVALPRVNTSTESFASRARLPPGPATSSESLAKLDKRDKRDGDHNRTLADGARVTGKIPAGRAPTVGYPGRADPQPGDFPLYAPHPYGWADPLANIDGVPESNWYPRTAASSNQTSSTGQARHSSQTPRQIQDHMHATGTLRGIVPDRELGRPTPAWDRVIGRIATHSEEQRFPQVVQQLRPELKHPQSKPKEVKKQKSRFGSLFSRSGRGGDSGGDGGDSGGGSFFGGGGGGGGGGD